MSETLINLDFYLFKLFNTPWPGGDQVMWAVSGLWWWTPLYLLLLWELWKKSDREWDRTLVRVFFLALCIAGTDVCPHGSSNPVSSGFDLPTPLNYGTKCTSLHRPDKKYRTAEDDSDLSAHTRQTLRA